MKPYDAAFRKDVLAGRAQGWYARHAHHQLLPESGEGSEPIRQFLSEALREDLVAICSKRRSMSF